MDDDVAMGKQVSYHEISSFMPEELVINNCLVKRARIDYKPYGTPNLAFVDYVDEKGILRAAFYFDLRRPMWNQEKLAGAVSCAEEFDQCS